MINTQGRYSRWCEDCGEDREMLPTAIGEYACAVCGHYYSDESGVIDNLEADDFYKLYKGAVQAGLIKHPDVIRDEYDY